jgi:hypothetical protein
MLKMSSTRISARTGMSKHGLSHPFKGAGDGWQLFDTHEKRVGAVPLHFQLEASTPVILGFPTHKNLKDWGRANVEAQVRKLFAGIYG